MPRPGVAEEKVRAAIADLEAAGQEVTINAVRARVGTGSFTTIGAIVAAWKAERSARESVPAVPERLGAALAQVWAEAWREASRVFDGERKALAEERAALERAKLEMEKEIERLEAALGGAAEEAEALKAANAGVSEALAAARTRLAQEDAAARVLRDDLREVKAELKKARADLTSWVERGTRAESTLSALRSNAGRS